MMVLFFVEFLVHSYCLEFGWLFSVSSLLDRCSNFSYLCLTPPLYTVNRLNIVEIFTGYIFIFDSCIFSFCEELRRHLRIVISWKF
ncbi:hypothetical protein EDC01DRAFT_64143 [Geopyxis carbonaria]|nr:hypothetical protein EDC01DRAFT_64143 [Geopyxis carbonaria]